MTCPKCDSRRIGRLGTRYQCECGFIDYGDAFKWDVRGHLVYDDTQAADDWREVQDRRRAAQAGVP